MTQSRGITSGLNAYEQALSEHQLRDFRSANLFRLVAQEVRPGSVIDVGAGGGGMVAWLLQHGYDARGIDLSPDTVKAAQRFLASQGLPEDRVRNIGLGQLIEEGETHDNVVSMDCIEHIEDDREAFSQLVSLCRPGGRIIVTVPALMAVYGARDRTMGHYRRYSRKTLSALTEGLPVQMETLRYWNILGVAPTFINQRIFGRAIDESFRYGAPTLGARALRTVLHGWFRHVESRIVPPLGLTLLMTVSRL